MTHVLSLPYGSVLHNNAVRYVAPPMNPLRTIIDGYKGWSKDSAPQMAAATAYYAVFALAPLLLTLIGIAGIFFGRADVEDRLLADLQEYVGKDGASFLSSALAAADRTGDSTLAVVTGVVVLLLGATGLFGALQHAANQIWRVTPKKSANGFLLFLLRRVFSFGLLLSVAFLLIVSLAASIAVAAVTEGLSLQLPIVATALPFANGVLSFCVIFVLFSILFSFLPDAYIPWRATWRGALTSALLFTLGKSILGWYLGRQGTVSAYGVAGSLVVILLWIYYSAQILFFGMEVSKAYVHRKRLTVTPRTHARVDLPR